MALPTYPDFHAALRATLAEIHTGENNPFSVENGFTIDRDDDDVYMVQGESWTFYLASRGDEWIVSADVPGLFA